MSVPKKRILSASVDIEINRISGWAFMLDCLAVSTDYSESDNLLESRL
jgi:hypothetical protein